VTDIPRRTAARTAKLASLPLGVAGRAAAGWGRRLAGGNSDEIAAQMMAKSAEQLFAVLGELKGGAMKFGQALSVFEAAVPDELAGPFRESLTKLQHAAPPMPTPDVHRMLAEQFGRGWRERFREFDEVPAAAASIGQVHRAIWRDGRDVAVKIQYPGAGTALMADLNQLARFARLFAALFPGMDVKPLIAELKARVAEELDYGLEADAQRAFAAAYAGDEQIVVPRVVASAPKVIVSEWLGGTPLSRIIADGTREERDRAGRLLAVLHFSGPQRAGMLHADPHPGNFRLLDDGRLGVIDFGATARLPDGHPEPIGRLLRWALAGKADEVLADLRTEGFVRPGVEVDAQGVLDYLRPLLEPVADPHFHFTRAWMQEQAARIADPRTEASRLGRLLNLPPAYLLIHRVTIGSIGVLCQLDAAADFRAVIEQWLPGFAD
jgi:predicted unusual protein kinase regulating ubiquinone biosynthesis (AarF/ABC1/UbiB family)